MTATMKLNAAHFVSLLLVARSNIGCGGTTTFIAPLDAGSDAPACAIDDLPGLVWVANLAALELHTPQARADDPLRPTAMVFDLDPGAPADVRDCARVAVELHDVLDQLGLHAVVKTSGSKGLHLSVGLRSSVDAETTKAFALALGRIVE